MMASAFKKLFFQVRNIFFPLFHGFGVMDGFHRGEGTQKAAFKYVLALIKGVELLLGFRLSRFQAGGQAGAVFGEWLQPGLHRLDGFCAQRRQLFRQLVMDSVELGQAAANADGAADREENIRPI